ncbi:MAG: DUF4215 domain-containing protein [Deltaproteobacteria bacterium]|nr:DUF4215 domain-containing protein [Deltaproteobacteria bacterium]
MPSGYCIICSNGRIQANEQCDDGNKTNGDGCSAICEIEPGWNCLKQAPFTCTPICGDGLLRGKEECDDGNSNNDDGCSSKCIIEADWWKCSDEPSICRLKCNLDYECPNIPYPSMTKSLSYSAANGDGQTSTNDTLYQYSLLYYYNHCSDNYTQVINIGPDHTIGGGVGQNRYNIMLTILLKLILSTSFMIHATPNYGH